MWLKSAISQRKAWRQQDEASFEASACDLSDDDDDDGARGGGDDDDDRGSGFQYLTLGTLGTTNRST